MSAIRIAEARTSVADSEHLEYLLDQADAALGRGETAVGISHLSQAILVASTKRTALPELDLRRRVKHLMETYGGFGA